MQATLRGWADEGREAGLVSILTVSLAAGLFGEQPQTIKLLDKLVCSCESAVEMFFHKPD